MSCARASTTQPSARRNTSRSELYEKTKQKWCLRILVWLVALLVLLGVADSCRVQEDPHRTLVQGSLQELNDSWTLETDQQAVYDIPESMGESLMLSIRSTKQKFSLGLRAAGGGRSGDGVLYLRPGQRPGRDAALCCSAGGRGRKDAGASLCGAVGPQRDAEQRVGAGHPDETEQLLFQAQPLRAGVLPALRPLRRGAWRSDGDDAQHLHSGGLPSDPGDDRADAGRPIPSCWHW